MGISSPRKDRQRPPPGPQAGAGPSGADPGSVCLARTPTATRCRGQGCTDLLRSRVESELDGLDAWDGTHHGAQALLDGSDAPGECEALRSRRTRASR